MAPHTPSKGNKNKSKDHLKEKTKQHKTVENKTKDNEIVKICETRYASNSEELYGGLGTGT